MRLGGLVPVLAAALAAGAAPGQEAPAVPPAADFAPELQRLLDAAAADPSDAPLIGFIARYPDDPEAMAARRALAARPAARGPYPGPDGDIAAGFDRARLAGPAALAAFAGANANHPLGAEAGRAFWRAPR